MNFLQLGLGIFFGIVIAFLAWKANTLTNSGGVAAAITGSLLFGLGGLPWAVLLLAFFTSSSALSRLFSTRKKALDEKFSKGARRDWAQVVANSGIGSLMVILHAVFPGHPVPWIAFAGVMAAVNADTWATEIGVLSKQKPRLVITFRPVERGTSGGVSLVGTLGALGGAVLIAALASLTSAPGTGGATFVFISLAGLFGSLVDSVLGATVQAIYTCPTCQKETERHPLHTCGTHTHHKRGWRWMDNDVVNLTASLAGAILATIFFLLVG